MQSPNQAISSEPAELPLALGSPEDNPKIQELKKQASTSPNSQAPFSSLANSEAQPIRVLVEERKIRGFCFTWSQVSGALSFASQIVNLIAVLVFGLWSVRSYNAALHANQISSSSLQAAQNANQLSLYAFCMSQTNNDIGTCGPVVRDLSLRSLASLVVPSFTASSVSSSVSLPPSLTSISRTSTSTSISLGASSSRLVTSTVELTAPVTRSTSASATTTTPPLNTAGSASGPHGTGLSLGAEIGAIVGGVLGFTTIMVSVAVIWRAKIPRAKVMVERE